MRIFFNYEEIYAKESVLKINHFLAFSRHKMLDQDTEKMYNLKKKIDF